MKEVMPGSPESIKKSTSLGELFINSAHAVINTAKMPKTEHLQEDLRWERLGPAGRTFEYIYAAVDANRAVTRSETYDTMPSRLGNGEYERATFGALFHGTGLEKFDSIVYSILEFQDNDLPEDAAVKADAVKFTAVNGNEYAGTIIIGKDYLGRLPPEMQQAVEMAARNAYREIDILRHPGRPLAVQA